jgi:hypothetical protein
VPPYVDTAHRASLLHAFACGLLAEVAGRSAWRDSVNLAAAILMVFFFAVTVLAYVLHGALRDTDNQLRRPHQLGKWTIPAGAMVAFMTALALVEVGSFGVILGGFLGPSLANQVRLTATSSMKIWLGSRRSGVQPVYSGSQARGVLS